MKDLEFLKSSIIAHRGLHNNEKGIIENSIEAFDLAISKKYIIELDVHILKDRTVVVFHDNNLRRTTKYDKDIKDCTYQEIKKLKMYNQNTFIPKFEDVLTLINGKVPILIELKYDMPTGILEEKVMQILNNYRGAYAIQSFNPFTVQWFKKNYPNIIRGQLSCDFKDEKNIFKKFVLKNMLFNLLEMYEKFKFKCNVINFIKYDSVEIFNNFAAFLIYLFGLRNAFEYGAMYVVAWNFVALITDTQWDCFEAIATVAKIDITQNKFNYKEHRKNAYTLLGILLTTIFIMFIVLHRLYDLDLIITLIMLSFDILNFIIYPIYRIKTCYLQLEYSAVKTTTNRTVANIIRMIMSFLKSPFCTGIGQVCSSIYQFITVNSMFNRNYKISLNGTIHKKREIV